MTVDFTEKNYWNSSPVKNYGSIFYLLPKGNTSLLAGPFISRVGLESHEVNGKVIQTRRDENLRRLFDYRPGVSKAEFINFICPYITLRQEVVAVGGHSYLLRYRFFNRAKETARIKVNAVLLADRAAAGQSISGSAASMDFDLKTKQLKPGHGVCDFSQLREWFIDSPALRITADFLTADPVVPLALTRICNGASSVTSEGFQSQAHLTAPAGSEAVYEMKVHFGDICDRPDETAVSTAWQSFMAQIKEPAGISPAHRFIWLKAWHVLFLNEVFTPRLHWCLTGQEFPSMWVWDTSPFIADAYLDSMPRFVQSLVSTQLSALKETGMMPLHVIMGLQDRRENPEEITQIPMVAASAWKVYQKTGDTEFAAHCFYALSANYRWWETRRKPDPQIPLWGIDDKRAPYFYGPESGMDNCPIYDSGPAYSIAINSAKTAFERAMAGFAAAMGQPSAQWSDRAEATLNFMREKMWDEEAGWYLPLTYGLEKIRIKTSDLYVGLYLCLFPDEHVRQIAQTLEKEFMTDYGPTTVSRFAPCFDPSCYARGSVWPFMNYMVYNGLRKAKVNDLAERILQGSIKALTDFPGIFECYDPIERKLGRIKDGPLCLPQMSFCAAGAINMINLSSAAKA